MPDPTAILRSLTRRSFLATSAATAGAVALPLGRFSAESQAAEAPAPVAFYVVGDTHYLANREAPARMTAASAEICGRLVEVLNRLPGEEIPAAAGGGRVATPRGVLHVGDVIDSGDKGGPVFTAMQQTEWAAFQDDYGLTGKEGRLKMPVYEIAGNHDSPHGTGHAIERIAARNRDRAGLAGMSPNGVHYSWDWAGVHFVNLGLIVGGDTAIARKRRYAALDSLDFLVTDLRDRVGTSGRPVIISHHIDIARHTGGCLPEAEATNKEWDPCDVRAYYRALAGYNVAGIFYGHTHARRVFQWDGESAAAQTGRHVFNNDNSSHFSGGAQAFFYVEVTAQELVVREYQTTDRWQTGAFTPLVWRAPLQA